MDNLPNDIKNEIIIFHVVKINFDPTKVTASEIQSCCKKILSIALLNKTIYNKLKSKLQDLKIIYDLVNKHSKYNKNYNSTNGVTSNPHLWALLHGKIYNISIETDIKNLIRLTPQCLKYTLCDSNGIELPSQLLFMPLTVACINNVIPINMIEYLLQHKAYENKKINKNTLLRAILVFLKSNSKRHADIKQIFKKYGYNKPNVTYMS